MLPGQMLPGQMLPLHLTSIKDGPIKLTLKFGQDWVSNSWDIPNMDKCRQVKCCLDKCQLDTLRKLPLKFHQNRVRNSWDIADIEFAVVVVVVVVVVV